MSKPVINFDALEKAPQNTTNTKKQTTKKASLFAKVVRKKEKTDKLEQDRTITFAKRPFENKLTLFFWGLFVCITLVLMMVYGRMDTMTRLAKAKAVNKQELVTNVKSDLTTLASMDYQGSNFLKALITHSANDTDSQDWEKAVTPYLAGGLAANNLTFSQSNGKQDVQNVTFIKQEALNADKGVYRLFYEVTYQHDKTPITLDVSFPVSFQKGQIKVLESPSISNLATTTNKNDAKVDDRLLEIKGDPVSADEEKKVNEFMTNFFDLYARNDEKLSMISRIQGLNGAKLDTQTVKTIVETNDHHLVVKGEYQVHFGEGNSLNSPYQVTLKKAGQSYFVETMNESGGNN